MSLPSPLPEPATPVTTPEATPEVRGPSRVAIQGGGHDRFGAVADMAVFREQARDLAMAYARRLGVTERDFLDDPDMTVLCIGMALCRQEEMLLQQQIQRELAERAVMLKGDYGAALFTATKNGVFERHQKAIDKAHYRATQYRMELEKLVKRRGPAPP